MMKTSAVQTSTHAVSALSMLPSAAAAGTASAGISRRTNAAMIAILVTLPIMISPFRGADCFEERYVEQTII
jgi:hypothetical protein